MTRNFRDGAARVPTHMTFLWCSVALVSFVLASCAPPAPETTEPTGYREADVFFDNPRAGVRLAGTFSFPTEGGPFPAVVLIHGSGRLDRRVEVAGHEIFTVLADYLSRRGVAVLRYDKRGLGGSTGDYSAATSNELGDDVLAAVEFLRARSDVDPARIGLVGLSEGGILGPAVANVSADVAFVVALGGPVMRGDELLALQADVIAAAEGNTPAERAETAELLRRFNVYVRSGEDRATLDRRLDELLGELVVSEQVRRALADREPLLSVWYRFYIDYDPAPALRAVRQPILFFIGEKDLQVPPEPNLALAEAARAAGTNPDFTVATLPRINHALQSIGPDQTGSPSEYGSIDETIAPAVLNLVGTWIDEQIAR